jgi:hypothetical protein
VACSVYVRLPEPAREALYDLAEREWRDPRDQAALFIMEGLKRAGVLPEEPSFVSTDRPLVTVSQT